MSRLQRQFSFLRRKIVFCPPAAAPPKRGIGPKRPNGSILIFTLWVLIVLSVLSCALAKVISGQIKFANAFIRSTVSLPLAKAALRAAIFERRQDGTKNYDSEKELITQREKSFQNRISYKYYFEDECSKININTASKDILQRLPGMDEESAEAVVNSGLRPFTLKEQVLLVEGISKDRFKQFKDFVTVYGDGKVNINSAQPQVLAALGLDGELIDIITGYRRESGGADGEKGTQDDGAFLSASGIISELRKFEMLTLRQEQDILSAMNVLSVKAAYLCLKVSTLINGKPGNNYSIVMDTNQKIIAWTE